MKWDRLFYAALSACTLWVVGLSASRSGRTDQPLARSYAEILVSGTLNATTDYSAVSCYLSGDTLAGFHYELIKSFAAAKGLQLHLVPEATLHQQVEGIVQGRYDVIASSVLVTYESADSLLDFTLPLLRHKQVLVQLNAEHADSAFVHNQLELAGKTVYIPANSPVSYRIHHLGREIGDTILVREEPGYGAEQLMAMVAHGDIRYAVCEESAARALLPYYPQLDVHTEISLNQFYAWGVSRQAGSLRDTLNVWLKGYMRQAAYKRLLRKYGMQ